MVGAPYRLEAVGHATERGISQSRACRLLGVSCSMVTYRYRQPEKDKAVCEAIEAVAKAHSSWGTVCGRLAAGK